MHTSFLFLATDTPNNNEHLRQLLSQALSVLYSIIFLLNNLVCKYSNCILSTKNLAHSCPVTCWEHLLKVPVESKSAWQQSCAKMLPRGLLTITKGRAQQHWTTISRKKKEQSHEFGKTQMRVQLTLEQHRFEQHISNFMRIISNKYTGKLLEICDNLKKLSNRPDKG